MKLFPYLFPYKQPIQEIYVQIIFVSLKTEERHVCALSSESGRRCRGWNIIDTLYTVSGSSSETVTQQCCLGFRKNHRIWRDSHSPYLCPQSQNIFSSWLGKVGASLLAQIVKNLPAMQETQV